MGGSWHQFIHILFDLPQNILLLSAHVGYWYNEMENMKHLPLHHSCRAIIACFHVHSILRENITHFRYSHEVEMLPAPNLGYIVIYFMGPRGYRK